MPPPYAPPQSKFSKKIKAPSRQTEFPSQQNCTVYVPVISRIRLGVWEHLAGIGVKVEMRYSLVHARIYWGACVRVHHDATRRSRVLAPAPCTGSLRGPRGSWSFRNRPGSHTRRQDQRLLRPLGSRPHKAYAGSCDREASLRRLGGLGSCRSAQSGKGGRRPWCNASARTKHRASIHTHAWQVLHTCRIERRHRGVEA